MKHYIDYMDNISADPALKSKIKKRMAEKTATRPRTPLKYALVACAAMLLLGIWIMPQAISNWRTPGGPEGQPRVIYWTEVPEDEEEDITSDTYPGIHAGSGQDMQLMPGGVPPSGWENPGACSETPVLGPPLDPPQYSTDGEIIADAPMADRRRIGFSHELTVEQMQAVFPNLGPEFTASAMYLVDGTLIEVDASERHTIDISSGLTHTRIRAAEGAIGHTVLFMHEEEPAVSYVYGVAVTTAIHGSEDFAILTADFMLENKAYHVRVSGPVEIGEPRLNEVVYLLISGGAADLSVLADPVIPELRDEWLTLEEARLDPDFGAFVPAYIPDRLNFDMANRSLTQHSNNLLVTWMSADFRENIWWIIAQVADYHLERFVAAADRHKFDINLYEMPFADTVPQEYWQIHMNPIFFAEELTFELVQARARWDGREDRRLGDTHMPGWRINFSVLYGDIVVDINTSGLTPEEVWEMVRPLS